MGEAFGLQCQAEKACDAAIEAFGLFKYINLDSMGDIEPTMLPPLASRAAMLRASPHDTTNIGQTPRSTKLKEKALAMLNE